MTHFATMMQTINATTLALMADVTVTWSGGNCNGILNDGYQDTLGMVNAENTVLVNSVDIAALSTATVLTISGVNYNQRERRPDGNGMVHIVLEPA